MATVDQRTFRARIRRFANLHRGGFGTSEKGDGYRMLVTPTLSSRYQKAAQRNLTVLTETYIACVEPT